MARQNLGSLLSVATPPKEAQNTVTPTKPTDIDQPPAGEKSGGPTPPTPAKPSQKRAKAKTPAVRFYDLERKETRLRPEQVEQLNTAARRLSKKRQPGAGERITENTLIRIAVDLLLTRTDDLTGDSEAELRKSVGL